MQGPAPTTRGQLTSAAIAMTEAIEKHESDRVFDMAVFLRGESLAGRRSVSTISLENAVTFPGTVSPYERSVSCLPGTSNAACGGRRVSWRRVTNGRDLEHASTSSSPGLQ
jgi:hypothetical protein